MKSVEKKMTKQGKLTTRNVVEAAIVASKSKKSVTWEGFFKKVRNPSGEVGSRPFQSAQAR